MNLRKILPPLLMLSLLAPSLPAREPGREWEIHLIHHTHVDIGYTEPQEDVMRKQWDNLEKAMIAKAISAIKDRSSRTSLS